MNQIDKVFGKAGDEAIDFIANKLHSNQAINKAFNVLGNGAIDCYNVAAKSLNSGNITEAVVDTFKQNGKWDVGRPLGTQTSLGAWPRDRRQHLSGGSPSLPHQLAHPSVSSSREGMRDPRRRPPMMSSGWRKLRNKVL